MEINQIVTQASSSVEIEFRAMERSLRATGCCLPISVFPYGDKLFDLPSNAEWICLRGHLKCLKEISTHPCHHRYAVLTMSNYQYADVDIVFLRNPTTVLADQSGFIATCTQWQLPQYAVTPESQKVFESKSSTWKLNVFNSGQFACDHAVYSELELVDALTQTEFRSTLLLKDPPWDQPGFNFLVHQASTHVTNLTLPPHNHPSTWAGDYSDDYRKVWDMQGTPYLIHWAGGCLYEDREINELFFEYLTQDEKRRFEEKRRARAIQQNADFRNSLPFGKRLVHDLKQLGKVVAPSIAEKRAMHKSNKAVD